jgi:hypothetical protein
MKYCITHFYSEGPPNDEAKNLSYCKDHLNTENTIFDNVTFYTPKILKDMGYSIFLKEYDVTPINNYYATMCKIGLSAWKPLILLLELEKMEEGDILVYRDVDFLKYNTLMNNDNIIEVINKCLEICKFDVFISRESEEYKLKHYTKPIVIEELGNNDNFNKEFPLLICNFIIIRKSKISIEFLNEWKDAVLNDKWIDGYLYDCYDDEFRNFNTNEQSICGNIIANWVKKRKYEIPLTYPVIGFENRDIGKIIYFNNYAYLDHIISNTNQVVSNN